MAANPEDIKLSDADRAMLAEMAEQTGRSWTEIFAEAIELWKKRCDLIDAVREGIDQADRGELIDSDRVFEKLQSRADAIGKANQ